MNKKYLLADILNSDQMCLHIEKGSVEGEFTAHSHDFCEIFFVIDGRAEHFSNGKKYMLEKGDVFAIREGDEHSFSQCYGFQLYNIMFPLQRLSVLGELRKLAGFWAIFLNSAYYDTTAYVRLTGTAFAQMSLLCTQMLCEYTDLKEGCSLLCESILTQILVLISRAAAQDAQNKHALNYRLARVLSHMESNFTNPMTVEELAGLAHVSKRHFARLFMQIYHITPLGYLLMLRTEYAKKLLGLGALSISEISTRCGFSDSNYFSKAFKKETGLSPRAWRKQSN